MEGIGFPCGVWAVLVGRIHHSSPVQWGRLAARPGRHREKGRTGEGCFRWISPQALSEQNKRNKTFPPNVFFIKGVKPTTKPSVLGR